MGAHIAPSPAYLIITEIMEIYVVTGGFFYESDSICALFMNEADAASYAAELKGEYDWAEVTLQTVHQTALGAA